MSTLEQMRREARARMKRRRSDPKYAEKERAYARQYHRDHPEMVKRIRARWLRKLRGDGRSRVYFVKTSSGQIKIGYAKKSLAIRIRELQAGSFERLKLMGWMMGSVLDEHALHRRFARLRIRGEWFRPGRELIAFIRKHASRTTA